MNDDQELIDSYLDGELTADEETRLADWLSADRENMRAFVRGVHFHRQLRSIMLAQPFRAAADAVVKKTECTTLFLSIASTVLTLRRSWLPIGACLALFIGAGIWYFGPANGQPMLADVQGLGVVLERSGQRLPATTGVRLQQGDMLKTLEHATVAVDYAPEKTRIILQPDTELCLASRSQGKHFEMRFGKLEASVAHQRPFRPMLITTPQAEARVIGTRFTLTVETNSTRLDVTEGKVRFTRLSDGGSVQVGAENFAVAASNYLLAVQPLPGKVLREVWLDLPGDTLLELRNHARFPNAPSERDFPPSFETNTNWPSAYGTRTRAYLLPPANGDYEFRLPDNVRNGQIRLMLSPDDDPADKLEICQIAFIRNRPGDESPRNTSRSQLESAPIYLDAGRRYYIEALHKFETGEDRLTILWKRPDGVIEPIPSECLAPFKGDAKKENR